MLFEVSFQKIASLLIVFGVFSSAPAFCLISEHFYEVDSCGIVYEGSLQKKTQRFNGEIHFPVPLVLPNLSQSVWVNGPRNIVVPNGRDQVVECRLDDEVFFYYSPKMNVFMLAKSKIHYFLPGSKLTGQFKDWKLHGSGKVVLDEKILYPRKDLPGSVSLIIEEGYYEDGFLNGFGTRVGPKCIKEKLEKNFESLAAGGVSSRDLVTECSVTGFFVRGAIYDGMQFGSPTIASWSQNQSKELSAGQLRFIYSRKNPWGWVLIQSVEEGSVHVLVRSGNQGVEQKILPRALLEGKPWVKVSNPDLNNPEKIGKKQLAQGAAYLVMAKAVANKSKKVFFRGDRRELDIGAKFFARTFGMIPLFDTEKGDVRSDSGVCASPDFASAALFPLPDLEKISSGNSISQFEDESIVYELEPDFYFDTYELQKMVSSDSPHEFLKMSEIYRKTQEISAASGSKVSGKYRVKRIFTIDPSLPVFPVKNLKVSVLSYEGSAPRVQTELEWVRPESKSKKLKDFENEDFDIGDFFLKDS